jgi:hypothetical protein
LTFIVSNFASANIRRAKKRGFSFQKKRKMRKADKSKLTNLEAGEEDLFGGVAVLFLALEAAAAAAADVEGFRLETVDLPPVLAALAGVGVAADGGCGGETGVVDGGGAAAVEATRRA